MRFLLLSAWLSSALAFADENSMKLDTQPARAGVAAESTLKVNRPLSKQFKEDERIQDMEMKAKSGSLSVLSMKFDLAYAGPRIDRLGEPDMPNPDHRARDNRTSLSGLMGLRLRATSDLAFNASTGVKWYTPYQAMTGQDVPRPRNTKTYDVSNPQASVDYTSLWGKVQSRSALALVYETQDYYVQKGQTGGFGFSQNLKYALGSSRWIVGSGFDLDFFLYSRNYVPQTDGKVANYYLSWSPSVEYKILDRLNFRTSIGFSYSAMRKFHNWMVWDQIAPTQRVGLGWGVTRDIYLNPYINFFIEHPKFATTSLSLMTVFSIF